MSENEQKDGNSSPGENESTKTENLTQEERKEKIQELKTKGNEFFKAEKYEEAIECYLQSLTLCSLPEDSEDNIQTRVILCSNLAASKHHLESYTEAIDYCNQALELNDRHLKALLRRAQLYKITDKLDESLADYQKYLELNPDDKTVAPIIMELKARIDERNEKLKTEMLGKLKSLGNMVLKPFGLSTDNFNLVQNPEGGYSVNFKQNNS